VEITWKAKIPEDLRLGGYGESNFGWSDKPWSGCWQQGQSLLFPFLFLESSLNSKKVRLRCLHTKKTRDAAMHLRDCVAAKSCEAVKSKGGCCSTQRLQNSVYAVQDERLVLEQSFGCGDPVGVGV
jgi:hypothetical protein